MDIEALSERLDSLANDMSLSPPLARDVATVREAAAALAKLAEERDDLVRRSREVIAPFLAAAAYETGLGVRPGNAGCFETWHREPLSLGAWFDMAQFDDDLRRLSRTPDEDGK